jgi:hypothetical protein
MWLARCSYVTKLLDPKIIQHEMEKIADIADKGRKIHPSCIGRDRFAAEHWIHSHPDVKPCDLYTNPNFTWGYDGLKTPIGAPGDFALMPAPRYELGHWPIGCRQSNLRHRLKEYAILYNATPPSDWWGWNLWHEDVANLKNKAKRMATQNSVAAKKRELKEQVSKKREQLEKKKEELEKKKEEMRKKRVW